LRTRTQLLAPSIRRASDHQREGSSRDTALEQVVDSLNARFGSMGTFFRRDVLGRRSSEMGDIGQVAREHRSTDVEQGIG
jgi:hypothetical protein